MNFYAAGGAVRDLILGRALRDVDYVFDDADGLFIQRNPSARKIKGMEPPLYLLDGQELCPLGAEPRDLTQNILARDFTVNALLLDERGVIRAHPLTFADLQAGLIRPVSDGALLHSPVRALRAARFNATLPGFAPHEDCLRLMRELPDQALAGIAAEQAGRESLKACLGAKPGNYLRCLEKGRCLAVWFAEFARAAHIPAGPPPWHDSSLLEHTARVMDDCARNDAPERLAPQERQTAVWMALCHDIGKNATPRELLPKHHGHDKRGEAMAEALGLRLRLPKAMVRAGAMAARLHMKAARYMELRPGSKADLLISLDRAGLCAPFFRLVAADSGRDDLPPLMRRDLERILALRLPRHKQGLGPASGAFLRQLRCA
ncbi:HD domain-containing protein, partial [Desulfovibrio sp. OttesenSCG-928-G11]|nr:HD domain-containing protein [Desulfovibrio sp. OttesenSCG-928-G11]